MLKILGNQALNEKPAVGESTFSESEQSRAKELRAAVLALEEKQADVVIGSCI